MAEVRDTLRDEYGITLKVITTRNPQSNSMVERCHQTFGRMIDASQVRDKRDLDPFFGWDGILAACRKAMNSTVHTTSRATPTQLVFGRDAMLNASFEADWQFIRERKQRLIVQNNKRENATRVAHHTMLATRWWSRPACRASTARTLTWDLKGLLTSMTMVLSGSSRSPIMAELSPRYGTSGISNRARLDPPCVNCLVPLQNAGT